MERVLKEKDDRKFVFLFLICNKKIDTKNFSERDKLMEKIISFKNVHFIILSHIVKINLC